MNSFQNFFLWTLLATIAPGLVTIASIALMIFLIDPELLIAYNWLFSTTSQWVTFSMAVFVMILTQSIGVLQQKIFEKLKLYRSCNKALEDGINSVSLNMDRELKSDNTFQRIAAQFYLSNNILVSFTIAIFMGIGIYLYQPFHSSITYSSQRFLFFIVFFLILYIIGIIVARARYSLLSKVIKSQ